MKKIIFLFFLITLISCSQKQEEVKEVAKMIQFEKPDYTISYPADWKVSPDLPKAEIFVCSKSEGPDDNFAENFSLMKQEELGESIDLYLYDSISKDQIFSEIGKDAVIESKMEGNHSYVIYKGLMNEDHLKWKQAYFIKNQTAYVLTYTAEEKSFDKYSDIAESIFNSFKLK